jgi:hypothetical protein
VSPILTATVVEWEIDVDVVWECTHWDQILWLDARPKRASGGYVCDLCPEDTRPTPGIWQTEIFEPFQRWDDDLRNAEGLSVSGTLTEQPGRG